MQNRQNRQIFTSQLSKPLSMRCSGDKLSIQRFRGYSRSEEAHICCSDQNETGAQKEKPNATSDTKSENLLVFFDENRKPNAKKWKIRKQQ